MTRRILKGLILFALYAGLIVAGLAGVALAKDPEDIVLGQKITLESAILGEPRIIQVFTPNNAKDDSAGYPVIYVLDGETHFRYIAGTVEYLSRDGIVPPMIVVGIVNVNRNRDFTPMQDAAMKQVPAGAEKFVQFMRQELFPYVEKNYKTKPFRLMFGHSLGGMFACHALVTYPDLFNGYIAASPYMAFANGAVNEQVAKGLAGLDKAGNRFFYATLGGTEKELQAGFSTLEKNLKKSAPANLTWKTEVIADENHSSVTVPTLFYGLRTIFAGWAITPKLLEKDLAAIDAHYADLSKRFGFKVEASEFLINLLGYQLMQKKKLDQAIAVLQENVKRFPDSANVYDSLGEAQELAGKLAEAEANYRIAVQKAEAIKHMYLKTYQEHLARIAAKNAGGGGGTVK